MLLGVIGTVAVCGAVAGKPPGLPLDPHSEGREVDPVIRDFYLPEPPPPTARSANEKPAESAVYRLTIWSLLNEFHDAIMNRLTMPLGTVPTDGK